MWITPYTSAWYTSKDENFIYYNFTKPDFPFFRIILSCYNQLFNITSSNFTNDKIVHFDLGVYLKHQDVIQYNCKLKTLRLLILFFYNPVLSFFCTAALFTLIWTFCVSCVRTLWGGRAFLMHAPIRLLLQKTRPIPATFKCTICSFLLSVSPPLLHRSGREIKRAEYVQGFPKSLIRISCRLWQWKRI